MPFFGSLAAAALSGVLGLAPFLVIYGIVASASGGSVTVAGVATIALAGLIATAAHLGLAAISTLLGHKAAFAVQRDLRLRLLDRVCGAPVSRIEGRAGELKKTALSDVDRLEGLLAHVLPDMAAGLAATLAGGIVLAIVDWRLLLAALALLPMAVAAQMWTYGGRAALFEQWNAAEAKANTALLSYVRGIATLRAFNRQASTLDNVRAAINELRDLAILITRKSRYPYSLFNSVLSTNLLLVLPAALLLYRAGRIDGAGFVLAATLGAALTAPLGKVVFATMVVARSSVAVARIRAVLETPLLPDGGQERGKEAEPAHNAIRLEKVCFSYTDGRQVLHDIDLEVGEGKLIAVVGPSGAGKSTLARLLLRLDDPSSGRVTIGGVDMRALPPGALQSRLSAVFQDSLLFHGTIADNIALARPQAEDSAVADALRGASAEAIAGGPAGTLALEISDRGQRLSGGEKQRVAIARALLKDAPILLLDEATAFVDAASEAAIQKAITLAGRDRTIIVIAHRLGSVRQADRIVVLAGGRIEAIGKHDELLHRSPTYRRLHDAHERAAGWKLARKRRAQEAPERAAATE
ncbi:ABC transporter ATP-binding protein [Pseudochelatococcus sp. B33]